MNLLVPAYAVAFLFVTVSSIRENSNEGAPRWVSWLEAVLTALAVAGYFEYHSGRKDPALVALWRVVAPVGVATYGVLVVRDLLDVEPEPDFSTEENVSIHTLGAFIAVIFLLPMAWANLRLAFG